ncbi:MAG: hypothetical protein QM690_21345 [Sphingobium sp.]
MIPTDTVTGHPYTPSWRADAANPPRYFLRGGSILERTQLEAELAGQYSAGRVYPSELYDAAREGVSVLLPSAEDAERIIELIGRQQEEEIAGAQSLNAMERNDLIEVYGALGRHWAPYRELMAQQARRRELAPLLAFSRFCTGWENIFDISDQPVAFEMGSDRLIPDGVLRRIDAMEMKAAGSYAFQLLYGTTEVRNFQQPSPSEGDQMISSPGTPRADGKSKAKSGRKTPGS